MGRGSLAILSSAASSHGRSRRTREVVLSIRKFITSPLVRATRDLLGRYIWTHPHISQTFRSRPAYQVAFKKTWLSLLWGGEAKTRQLREALAVAISAANQCLY